tara:strand:- start:654 stop:1040 length:387 start_codon:yes stop_codon:yes gene_type:complete
MTNISERNHQKNELANLGYSLKYIDEWSPKITLYRHRPARNQDNVIVEQVGTFIEGVPGEPSYVLKKAKIGLFPWKPNEGCTCQWCNERKEAQVVAKTELVEATPESSVPIIPRGRGKRRMGPYYKGS